MQCNQCKSEMPESVNFCPICGVGINTTPLEKSPVETVKVWNRSVVLSFVGWLFLYALVASYYDRSPFLLAFFVQILVMLVIYLGIFGVACFGGLLYKAFGKSMPWKRIVNSTLISSFALGWLFIYLSRHYGR